MRSARTKLTPSIAAATFAELPGASDRVIELVVRLQHLQGFLVSDVLRARLVAALLLKQLTVFEAKLDALEFYKLEERFDRN